MKRILCLRIGNFAAQPIDALQTVAARCKQFTPLVGIDPHVFPQSVLLDITNVVHLFGGEAALVERILGELRDHDWQLRAAVAHTPGAAWALAGYGGKDEGGRMKDEDRKRQMEDGTFSIHPSSFILHPSLSLLPLQALRLPEPIVALLHSLGVWQIEQLQALPRRKLSSRFGPELLDCLDRVTGRLSEPLPAWDPPPQFEVRWSAEFPTARREAVESALEHLVRRLAAMLARAGRGAMRLECLLKCTTGRGTCEAGQGVALPPPLARSVELFSGAQPLQVARPDRWPPRRRSGGACPPTCASPEPDALLIHRRASAWTPRHGGCGGFVASRVRFTILLVLRVARILILPNPSHRMFSHFHWYLRFGGVALRTMATAACCCGCSPARRLLAGSCSLLLLASSMTLRRCGNLSGLNNWSAAWWIITDGFVWPCDYYFIEDCHGRLLLFA